MVEELEITWPKTGESPETTWRARILWRSVEDANAELSQTLHDTEAELSHTPQARASFLQLYRDFRRVQRKYLMMSSRHLIEQQAQVTSLLFRQQQAQQQQAQANHHQPYNNNNNTSSRYHTLQRASPATTVSSRSSLSRHYPSMASSTTSRETPTPAATTMGNGRHNYQPPTTMQGPAWTNPTLQQTQNAVLSSTVSPHEVSLLLA